MCLQTKSNIKCPHLKVVSHQRRENYIAFGKAPRRGTESPTLQGRQKVFGKSRVYWPDAGFRYGQARKMQDVYSKCEMRYYVVLKMQTN